MRGVLDSRAFFRKSFVHLTGSQQRFGMFENGVLRGELSHQDVWGIEV
jgi:hypothetical protein